MPNSRRESGVPGRGKGRDRLTDFTPTPQMLEIAEAAREQSTMTADELFAAIIIGIKRRKELAIMALDLYYNYDAVVEAANAEYAESVGKSSTEGMSDDEKQQALLIWTLKQGEGGSAD